jgi:putative RecB family exonuclease
MQNQETTPKKIKLSVSSIKTFQDCPKKYWYGYIEKPPIEKKPWVHLEFGSCLHLALEKFHEFLMEHQLPSTEYPGLMKKCLESAVKDFNQDLLGPEAKNMQLVMQSYLNDIKLNGLPHVLWVEKPFEITIGDFFLKGFIDRVDQTGPGAYKVVDYKTTKNPAYLDSFQLLVYAMVLKNELPDLEKISGSYTLLKHDCKPKSWDFTFDDLKKCEEKIIKYGNLILNEQTWQKKPSKLCDFCDYKEFCMSNWSD